MANPVTNEDYYDDKRNEEVSQNLLEALRHLEKAHHERSWTEISFAISSLRDVMELVPDRKPLPWEPEVLYPQEQSNDQ